MNLAQLERCDDVEGALRALLLDPDGPLLPGVEPARQRALRRLVQNNLRGAVKRAIPHALRLAGPDATDALLTRFLHEAPPTTRFIREVPAAFARFVGALADAELPHPALRELVHWETVELEVLMAPDTADVDACASRWVPDPSARLVAYRHDVIAVNESTCAWPDAGVEPVFALCFRAADRVRTRRISSACARALGAIAEGAPVDAVLPAHLTEPVERELQLLRGDGALHIHDPSPTPRSPR